MFHVEQFINNFSEYLFRHQCSHYSLVILFMVFSSFVEYGHICEVVFLSCSFLVLFELLLGLFPTKLYERLAFFEEQHYFVVGLKTELVQRSVVGNVDDSAVSDKFLLDGGYFCKHFEEEFELAELSKG